MKTLVELLCGINTFPNTVRVNFPLLFSLHLVGEKPQRFSKPLRFILSAMKCTHQTGFTLLEIVLVITLIGILAVTIVPKVETRWFEQRSEFHQILTALRYAHQIAIASECQIRVQVNGKMLSLYYNGIPTRCGSEAVTNPIMNGAVKVQVNANIHGKGWIYNEQGHPISGQQNLTIGDNNLRVEAGTGFVHIL